eukprot:SAG31_NODE_83_length_27039_cov_14.035746_8_plen_80_part_00
MRHSAERFRGCDDSCFWNRLLLQISLKCGTRLEAQSKGSQRSTRRTTGTALTVPWVTCWIGVWKDTVIRFQKDRSEQRP